MIQSIKTNYKGKQVTKYRYRCYYTTLVGERKQKSSKLFDTRKQAVAEQISFLASHKSQINANGIYFSDLYNMYKEDMRQKNTDSTYLSRVTCVNYHILPVFEKKKIDEITVLTIRTWQNEMLKKTILKNGIPQFYKKSYLKRLHSLLVAILAYGTKYYGLPNNAALLQGTFKNDIDTKKDNYYTYDEFINFINSVQDDDKLIFNLLYYTGLRIGEALALTWTDITDYISVTKTVTYSIAGGITTSPPKTRSSTRIVNIPSFLHKDLMNEKNKQKVKYGFSDTWYVFGNIKPISPGVIRKKLDKIILNHNLKPITPHGFRHSHASLLINGGMNIKLISNRLGHKNSSETINTYSHMFPEQRGICVDYLDSVFDKSRHK